MSAEDWKTRPTGLYFVRQPDGKGFKSSWMIIQWDLEYAKDREGYGWLVTSGYSVKDEHLIIHGPVVGPDDGRRVILITR